MINIWCLVITFPSPGISGTLRAALRVLVATACTRAAPRRTAGRDSKRWMDGLESTWYIYIYIHIIIYIYICTHYAYNGIQSMKLVQQQKKREGLCCLSLCTSVFNYVFEGCAWKRRNSSHRFWHAETRTKTGERLVYTLEFTTFHNGSPQYKSDQSLWIHWRSPAESRRLESSFWSKFIQCLNAHSISQFPSIPSWVSWCVSSL